MSAELNQELHTKLIGDSELVVVGPHLQYRVDQVRFPSGHEGTYTYIDDNYAAVAAVPVDRRNGARSYYLIPQERYPSQSVGWEVPAGGPKPGESQLEAAQRELMEEAGLEAALWHQLPLQYENVGRGNSRSDIVVAAGITVVGSMVEADEVIGEGRWFTGPEVEDLMLDGSINSGHTMASIAMTNAFMNRNPTHPITMVIG